MAEHESSLVRVPADVRDLLRFLAREDGRTMGGFLRRLLCEYAAREGIDPTRAQAGGG